MMKAMVLKRPGPVSEERPPLEPAERPIPVPDENEILLKVSVCGVCHTELDEIEGRTPPPHLPVVPGHQVVGRVEKCGNGITRFSTGDRAGVGWIFSSCGTCRFCLGGEENLCSDFRATGRDADGGYAEYMTVPEPFAFPIPEALADSDAAPLLCAGAIGYRSLRFSNITGGRRLGLTGFGASAHLVLKMVRHRYPDVKVYVFARNQKEREFALELGAVWAGDTADGSPEKCDSIIDTTPAWKPVVEGLANLERGGRFVVNAIGKEDADKEQLLRLRYQKHLWLEKEIKSVANVARRDIAEFIALAVEMAITPEVREYSLDDANRALLDLKNGRFRGAKVLRVG